MQEDFARAGVAKQIFTLIASRKRQAELLYVDEFAIAADHAHPIIIGSDQAAGMLAKFERAFSFAPVAMQFLGFSHAFCLIGHSLLKRLGVVSSIQLAWRK
ncbi:MAG: hypothetical protein ABSC26_09090 [Stellaceae bacterium]|jgi:hypothetical protein